MRPSDNYRKWIERSEEDNVYLGLLPSIRAGVAGTAAQADAKSGLIA